MPYCDEACVSSQVAQRGGLNVELEKSCGSVHLPPGESFDRPVAEDEAVLVSIWNNAAFHELLTELQLTRADLIQAELLPNPEVVYFFNVPDKPFKYAIDCPIEALWLRPIRIKIAGQENERACQRLVQAALDLIRDTRQAYADLLLARERLRVAEEAVKLRGRIAELADARLRAGDISQQEVASAKIDALLAKQDATRLGYDIRLSEERLRLLMGLSDTQFPLMLVDDSRLSAGLSPETELEQEAVGNRPDAQALEHAVEAAAERLRLAKLGWVRLLGILDATSGRNTGHEFSPAFRGTLPIFNRNQGGISRAEAELERLNRQRVTLHNQIVLDVRLSYARCEQARAEWDVLQQKVRPEVETAIRRAEAAYQEGNVTYLIVLEATRQMIDTMIREAQLKAELRRAQAELERSVGRRLNSSHSPATLP